MSLNTNPIFLTQKRMVHRGGVLAAILISALVGLSLLAGLISYLAAPGDFPGFKSPQEAGKVFYGWTAALELLVLAIGGFSRISRILGEERKAGLWDSNRLTPLKPWQLITGYWFGSPLREFYMGAALAGTGLVIVLLGRLPVTLWAGTQVLIFSTALFLGLLGLLFGLTFKQPQGGVGLLIMFIVFQMPSAAVPRFIVTNFLLPIYGMVNLFISGGNPDDDDLVRGWGGLPHVYGVPVYSILLTVGLQFLIGIFLWRAAVRKTVNPFQPLMLRWEAAAIFGILLLAQHGLVWEVWRGHFPARIGHISNVGFDYSILLSVVHCGTMLLAIMILAGASPQPETVRVKALRLGFKNFGAIFPGSAVSLALVLAAVAGAALLSQCMFSLNGSWKVYLIAVGNLLSFCLIFSLLLEFCRMRHRRRALGFVALWLFVLCALPFILAGVLTNAGIGKLSLLAPGAVALASENDEPLNYLLGIVAAHFCIAIVLFLNWRRQWKLLLETASADTLK